VISETFCLYDMFPVFTVTAAATNTYSSTTSPSTVVAGIIVEDKKCYSFSVKISPNVSTIQGVPRVKVTTSGECSLG